MENFEAHSSLIEDGVNSINFCCKFIDFLNKIQNELIVKYQNKRYFVLVTLL